MRKKEGEEINKSLAQLQLLGFGPEILRKLNTDQNVSLTTLLLVSCLTQSYFSAESKAPLPTSTLARECK